MSIDTKAIADIDAVLVTTVDGGGTHAVTTLASHFYACIVRWAPEGPSYRKLGSVRRLSRRVKHWRGGKMTLETEERVYQHLGAVASNDPLVLSGQVVGLLCASECLLALLPSNKVAARRSRS
jgi:hypothetical protein